VLVLSKSLGEENMRYWINQKWATKHPQPSQALQPSIENILYEILTDVKEPHIDFDLFD
jgi:hypothetical protein